MKSGDAARLRKAIDERRATVAVIGLGYVGLPLLDVVQAAGFGAIGLDSDPTKIERLNAGENYLPHLGADLPERLARSRRVTLTSDPSALKDADIVLVCVPTPLDRERRPDLGFVTRAALAIREHAIAPDPERPRLVVLESTTYPGTTRDVLGPILREKGDPPVFTAFSPEREDPGNKAHTTRSIPKLVGGVDELSSDLVEAFYGAIVERVVRCRSAEVAEAAKLVENVYRAVNIALVNELKMVLDALKLDVWEVLDAAATKPFGFQRFDPGPGFGGHCVPIDPFYLADSARRAGVDAAFIELAGEVNRRMPQYVIDKCAGALAGRGLGLEGARVLVLGVAYKANIGDVRESPSLRLILLLRERGADVSYHDPYVARTWKGREHDLEMDSAPWSEATLRDADLVLIATDHEWYDFRFVGEHARLIVDTRNAMARVGGSHRATIVLA